MIDSNGAKDGATIGAHSMSTQWETIPDSVPTGVWAKARHERNIEQWFGIDCDRRWCPERREYVRDSERRENTNRRDNAA
jgi:hypothetical protein